MHTLIRHYACQHCDKSFTQPCNLKKHLVIHQLPRVSQRKIYRCNLCRRGYTQRYNYKVISSLELSLIYGQDYFTMFYFFDCHITIIQFNVNFIDPCQTLPPRDKYTQNIILIGL